ITGSGARANNGGWEPVVRSLNLVTEFSQRLEKGRLWPLVHPWYSVHSVNSLPKANHGRQKSRRRAGIADKNFQRFFRRASVWNFAAQTIDSNCPVARLLRVRLDFNLKTKVL